MATMLWDALAGLKLAAGSLTKRPVYAAIAAFTLALGITANVAIVTVANSVLLRPLPYPAANRIVEVRHHAPGLNLPELQHSPGLVARSVRRRSHRLSRAPHSTRRGARSTSCSSGFWSAPVATYLPARRPRPSIR